MNAQPDDPTADAVSNEALEHAIHRLNDAVPRQEVIAELVGMGVTEEAAVAVVRRAEDVHGSAERPAGGGASPLGTFLKVVGYLLVALGFALWIGNSSGWLVTFPFAGLLTVLLGTGLIGLVHVREAHAAKPE